MNDLKSLVARLPQENGDASSRPENASPRDRTSLPISNWDDYKSWCEKVKENWDVN